MEIEVELFAFLRFHLPKGTKGFNCKMQLNEKMSVADILKELKIPDEVTQIIMINGAHAEKNHILSDGDVLTVLPIAAGG